MADKKGLDLEILKQVIRVMEDHNLGEVSIEQNDIKIQVKRMSEQPLVAMQGAATLAAKEEAAYKTHAPATANKSSEDSLVIIPAPMVGTFYRAPTPEAEPFVEVGDEVEADQVICIIDAMKLMNEIVADVDGEIVEILLEDGQPVEYDQPMFRIRPKG